MNLQPWTLSFTASRFEIDSGDRSALDLGIALCHAEAALRTPHRWHFAQSRREPRCVGGGIACLLFVRTFQARETTMFS